MKRLISFVLVGLLVACHEPITEPPSPNFAARGCEPGPSHHGRGSNPCRLLALLAPVYSVLHNTQDNYYNVSEISTYEMMVPTRGQDWYDGGTWLDLHHQTWTATSPATLTFLNGVWNDAFSGITRANELLDALRNARGRDQAIIAAEARTLRAFYYYQLTDMFGGVPIFTTPQFAPQPRNTRAELYRFIDIIVGRFSSTDRRSILTAARQPLTGTGIQWSSQCTSLMRLTLGKVTAPV